MRLVIAKALIAYNCDVREATNGFNALFAMESKLPDLLLLDINMPIMGGLQMLTMMRSNPTLQKIPVIMLASPTDHLVMDKIQALGVSGTLLKPFNVTALIEKIGSTLTLVAK